MKLMLIVYSLFITTSLFATQREPGFTGKDLAQEALHIKGLLQTKSTCQFDVIFSHDPTKPYASLLLQNDQGQLSFDISSPDTPVNRGDIACIGIYICNSFQAEGAHFGYVLPGRMEIAKMVNGSLKTMSCRFELN